LDVSFNLLAQVKKTIFYFGFNFPTPNILLSIVCIWVVFKKETKSKSLYRLILAILFFNFLFAFRYNVPDQYVFFFTSYFVFAILIGLGADFILKHFNKKSFVVFLLIFFSFLPVAVYYKLPSFLQRKNINIGFTRDVPYRDNYTYFLWPCKRGYIGARQYGEEVLKQVESNSVIIADHTPFRVLKYLQLVEGKRKDVEIIGLDQDVVKSILEQNKKVYLADDDRIYYPDWIFKEYKVVKNGIIFEVKK
jgi:hypothetical protein